jgi:hypothetical protein
MKKQILFVWSIVLTGMNLASAGVSTQGLGFNAPTISNKSAITNEVTGEIVYDTVLNQFFGWTGSTWTALGEPATVAVRAQGDGSTTQSVPNATYTVVVFNTEAYDAGGWFTSGTTFTAPSAGKYHVSALVAFSANSTGQRELVMNTSNVGLTYLDRRAPLTSVETVLAGSTTIALAQGETLTVSAYQTSGGALNLSSINSIKWISIERVGN